MDKNVFILIRGLPGSGKSTLASCIAENVPLHQELCWVEADQYFEKDTGVYKFDPEKLPHAHEWCYNEARSACEKGVSPVIVSNTSCSEWEYRDYLDMAKRYGYKTQVIDVHGEFESEHGVPKETLEKMERKWKPFDRKLLTK